MDLRAFANVDTKRDEVQSVFSPAPRGEYVSRTVHRVQQVAAPDILKTADLLAQTDEQLAETLFAPPAKNNR